jgi:hypothetical protein
MKEILPAMSNEFLPQWNLLQCIGSTDRKHIRLKRPSNSWSMYYNYEHYYSTVLQALDDS